MGETLAEAILGHMRVLITGMSGAGKSALVNELRRRGLRAFDADEDGFSEPRADGRGGGRADGVAALLTAPVDVLLERLQTRTGNRYGQSPAEEAQVLA